MYLCFLFCILLFIPIFTSGDNLKVPKNEVENPTRTTANGALSQEKSVSDSNITVITEGGSVVSKLPTLSLPKEKHTNLINLDKEIEKSNKTSVKPRKGVVYTPSDDSSSADINLPKERMDTTVSEKSGSIFTSKVVGNPSLPVQTLPTTSDIKTDTSSKLSPVTTEIPVTRPKKPLILSYEALSEVGMKIESEKKLDPKLETSPKSIVADQLASPNMKMQSMNASRHPDMIMPIVISILVVPMFAILGFVALRRGQEAWRNRHYKRMDFLLDGMYND